MTGSTRHVEGLEGQGARPSNDFIWLLTSAPERSSYTKRKKHLWRTIQKAGRAAVRSLGWETWVNQVRESRDRRQRESTKNKAVGDQGTLETFQSGKNNWGRLSLGSGVSVGAAQSPVQRRNCSGLPACCRSAGSGFSWKVVGGYPFAKTHWARVSTLCIIHQPILGRLSKLRFLSPSRIFLKKSVLRLCWSTKPRFMSIFFSREGSKCGNLYMGCFILIFNEMLILICKATKLRINLTLVAQWFITESPAVHQKLTQYCKGNKFQQTNFIKKSAIFPRKE